MRKVKTSFDHLCGKWGCQELATHVIEVPSPYEGEELLFTCDEHYDPEDGEGEPILGVVFS